ncbi:rab GTPase-activating protein 22 [Manihot esculenta]|uniref:Rab-GAP TBC domain-containing protein n=1 Tax=Manihot esculenta TaxID=3983 RepID=A0A2C9WK54_MANES|nr:rab GTPase-activating protein 22 [Manihot esculenta]OAY59529.1 hypothetical protein MANES_01G038300v8 [Manihot esculenta]
MFNSGNNSPDGIPRSGGGTAGEFFWAVVAAPQNRTAVAVTTLAGIAVFAAIFFKSIRGGKSPWSHRRRQQTLTLQQWRRLFTPDGRFCDGDGGIQFLKIVRSGGVDPSIRPEVWPFLLGVYDLNSSKEERDDIKNQNRKKYEELRRQCLQLLSSSNESLKPEESGETVGKGDSRALVQDSESPDSDSSVDPQSVIQASPSSEGQEKNQPSEEKRTELQPKQPATEDFATWQRIIRVDAVRANAEWIPFSPSQASVSEDRARGYAEAVGLKDYDHLEPCRIFHAARLVAILEAYAIYDPEIGYCQGMSDLLSPIITVITKDAEAFWCFVGFMKKARHNFRLDEVGIQRQLNIVSRIIKCKDLHLFRHLEKLQAEDCFFVYRMVVVMFRRELTFEQTMRLWEVMWADQAAIRAGISKSAWSMIRQRVPPTEDLLLYAIAASVLQRRKLIIERYNSMDEILRECNSMAGQLDVWKLLDDAHELVMNLHDKIETAL